MLKRVFIGFVWIVSVVATEAEGKATTDLTNHFIAICTLRDSLGTLKNGTPLSSLHPNFPPAIADHDFLAFDAKTHSFLITTNAARRLTLMNNSDTPFILTTRDHLIFVGVLSSYVSSRLYGFPTVFVERLSEQLSNTNKDVVRISFVTRFKDQQHDLEGARQIENALKELQATTGTKHTKGASR